MLSVQQEKLIADANYCILKFSVGPEAGSIVRVLNAFPVGWCLRWVWNYVMYNLML